MSEDKESIEIVRILSIDIGYKNLCLSIEEFSKTDLIKIKKDLEKIPKTKRFNQNGTASKEMKKVLEKIYKTGRNIFLENKDLTSEGEVVVKESIPQSVFEECYSYLRSKKKWFDLVDIVVIEFQVKKNPKAQKMEQHVYSFFVFSYSELSQNKKERKIIVPFLAGHKTKMLGMEKPKKGLKAHAKKTLRKKWSVENALYIAKLRKDDRLLEELSSKKKADDKADTINQLQAFKLRVYLMDII